MTKEEINHLLTYTPKEQVVYMIIRQSFLNHKMGFDITKFEAAYSQPHRHYHTWKHIEDMVMYLVDMEQTDDETIIATVYHDYVYDPKANNNEEKSAEQFKNDWKGETAEGMVIYDLIMDTKTHKPNNTRNKTYYCLSISLINADLHIFEKSFSEIIEYDKQIFKEYQFVDWNTYRTKRLEVLETLAEDLRNTSKYTGICYLIEYFKTLKPKIAVFAGSFNPFHIGHKNILDKAEQIFDKVILARGINAGKNNGDFTMLPMCLNHYQQEMYHGLITDYIKGLDYDNLTLVRGLRNAKDLDYELTMCQYIKDLGCNIPIVFITCDGNYNHISSSAIKTLPKKEQERYLDFNKIKLKE